jgi:hypothetical protein
LELSFAAKLTVGFISSLLHLEFEFQNHQKMKKPADLTLEEWNTLYPKFTMKQIADKLQCGETTVHKWLTRAGLAATKKHRVSRIQEHKDKLSLAHKGKLREKTGKNNNCEICGKAYYVIPARAAITKYCSMDCKGVAVSRNQSGKSHPGYIEGAKREKNCEGCGCQMLHKPPKPITSFLLQKFCTKKCADEHGLRFNGADHYNYKGELARRRNRTSQHSRWANKVLQRDLYLCKRCGVSGEVATLQAHHIFPFELFPEKRDDLNNGVSLCSKCHWEVHDTLDSRFIFTTEEVKIKRAEKTKKQLLVSGESFEGKVFGKDARKWKGNCYWCAELVIKRLSDVTGKKSVFCSRECSGKHRSVFTYYKEENLRNIPSTVRPPERVSLK